MADIANYKDKLLQAYLGERVTSGNGFGDVEWPDVLDSALLKPEDNSTLGAEFDKNIPNLANTHNIAENAVTESQFDETYDYDAGTEIMTVSIDLKSYGGSQSIIFISGNFQSNSVSTASTTKKSRVIMVAKFNNTTLWDGEIARIPNQEGTYFFTTFSDKFSHAPSGTGDNIFLVTKKGTFLSAGTNTYLMAGKQGYETNTYTISFEYVSDCDGTRGKIIHLSVYGLTLKR